MTAGEIDLLIVAGRHAIRRARFRQRVGAGHNAARKGDDRRAIGDAGLGKQCRPHARLCGNRAVNAFH